MAESRATKKPELGTCRTASKPATHWIDNLKPHIKTQNCVGWQALPPSPQQVSGRRENKAVAASQGDDLKSSFAHNNERPESILGESGAGTLRSRAFEEVMGASDMPNSEAVEYDEWLFNRAWNAALRRAAEIARYQSIRAEESGAEESARMARVTASAIEREMEKGE